MSERRRLERAHRKLTNARLMASSTAREVPEEMLPMIRAAIEALRICEQAAAERIEDA